MSDETCPYAPRHKADHRGVCTHCGVTIAEPWYMRRRPEPEQMVAEIARKSGHELDPYVAREIVAAMFSWADHALEVRETVVREAWGMPDVRVRVRQDLWRKLLDEVTAHGMIPTALPSEALRYLPWPSFANPAFSNPDDAPEVPAAAEWRMIQVILAVQCRMLPVDRVAAVKAGLL